MSVRYVLAITVVCVNVAKFNPDRCSDSACMFGSVVKRLKIAGSCSVVNVAGTTVAVRVLSSGTRAVNQTEANPNFTQGQAVPCGNVSPMAGTGPRLEVAGPSSVNPGSFARQSTTTVQVSCCL